MKLTKQFYMGDDVTLVARQLLGCRLITKLDSQRTSGMIVETEAYSGSVDRASHAFHDKRTPRTEIMFAPGGIAYVYFVYGMHYMFNVVTNKIDRPEAVLIRAIQPCEGIDIMKVRRGISEDDKALTGGPARLAQALGITTEYNSESLQGSNIWIENGEPIATENIIVSSRIGVDYAGSDALLPWRFYIKDNKYVSR